MGGDTFNWGVIGTGGIAGAFAADLRGVAGARLASVCSRDAARAATFAATHGASRSSADLDLFLADPGLDAVYVATPNALHAEQALAAIAAGKAVLVEKPLATTAADARRIADAAAASGVFAMEGLWTRFLPAVRAARALIDEGRIGTVREIRAELAYERPETDSSRFYRPELGGGAALDLGVYPLSLAIHLLGPPLVASGTARLAVSGVDVSADFHLGFAGAEAYLSCGFDREGDNRFIVIGSGGALRLEAPFLKAQRLTLFSAHATGAALAGGGRSLLDRIGRRLPRPGRRRTAFPFGGGGLQFEAEAVMKAVRAGETGSVVLPLSDSIAVLEVIDRIRADCGGP